MPSSSIEWSQSAARKLLAREISNRNIPFEAKKMSSKAVFDKYQSDPAFEGVDYDKTFQQRLGRLRKLIKEKEEDDGIDWKHSKAKIFLQQAFRDNIIPLDYSKEAGGLGPKHVWDTYCANDPSFEGMAYNSIFTRRLADVAENHKKKNKRSSEDEEAYKQYRAAHPVRTHNDFGFPRWQGSEAERLLKKDMSEGKHVGLKPQEFRLTRPQFLAIPLPIFRDHIYQEQRLGKFHHYLETENKKKKQKLK